MVKALVQRNSREQNELIKNGDEPSEWSANTARQKDVDARWGSKHGVHHFGYKNNIKIDRGSKLIENYLVTAANEHDSQAMPHLVQPRDQGQLYLADSAYGTPANHAICASLEISLQAVEQARRNTPLTAVQKTWNRLRSRLRARVEHVFGHMHMCIKGQLIRCVGMERAHAQISMTNLVYNMQRVVHLKRHSMGSV
jgi:transposase, IS5 family